METSRMPKVSSKMSDWLRKRVEEKRLQKSQRQPQIPNPNLPLVNLPKSTKQKKSKSKPKQKKRGRKRILRAFEETTIGYNIKLRAPLEYDLIMNFSGAGEQPEADLIEAIGYASLNPYFRTTSFRKLLIKYRQNGCYQTRPKKPASSQQVRKHIEIRRNRAKNSTSKT